MSEAAMSLTDAIGAPAYHAARAVTGAAARVYFRRIEVLHRERVPERGALLVVANHPASFSDVVLLASAIPRRLHFLAMAPTFKPWIRGFALRLCGTLPVYRKQDDPTLMGRNDDTFRACHEILDQGGAILIFPEGTSLTDRSIVKVKTGAARIALGQEERPGQAGRLTLLPVGLHLADRTRFQTGVDVSVGRPIEIAPFRDQARVDPQAAVRALTEHLQGVLEKLIVNVPDVDQAALVSAIERIYLEDARTDSDTPDVGISRGMAECIGHFSRVDPDRIATAWYRVRQYEQELEALRVRDRAVRDMLPPAGRTVERIRLLIAGLLGVVPAVVGGLIHYVPYRLCGQVGRLANPTQVAAFRIGLAIVLFPLTYAAIAWGLWRGLGWSPRAVATALVVIAVLGLHALAYFQWLAHQQERIRLVFWKSIHRRRIALLRRRRRELIRMCERSKQEFDTLQRADRAQPTPAREREAG